MPRIRSIKPEIWGSTQVMNVTRNARLLFVGMITLADDAGRGSCDLRKLKGNVFPGDDDVTSATIVQWLNELSRERLIVRYTISGDDLYSLPTWHKHQKINRPSPSRYAAPIEDSVNPHGTLTEHSLGDRIRDQGSDQGSGIRDQGTDQGGDAGNPNGAAAPVGLSLPLDDVGSNNDAPKPETGKSGEGKTAEPKPDSEAVLRIFEHWRTTHHHPQAKLDDKRRKVISKALALGYSEDVLCQSIAGYLNSRHHMGQNDKGTTYDDIELMLRDAKHIDAGIKSHSESSRIGLSEKSRKAIDNMAGWTPPPTKSRTQ